MRRILLSMLLAVSLVGLVKAQEMTGDAAENDKKEILKIEQDKLDALRKDGLRKNASAAADWFHRYDDDGMIMVNLDGTITTKAEHEPKLRSHAAPVII